MTACPVLDVGKTSGIAEALRLLDCKAGEATGAAFSRLFGTDGALLPALTILLTLYVAFLAIGLLTGRTRLGLSALTPRMMTLGLVLTFVTSWVAYQSVVWTLAIGAPDQIASILLGTRGSATEVFAGRVDILFNAIAQVADQAGSATTTQAAGTPHAGSFTAVDLMWLSALMLLLGTVGVLVTARIALAVLLALGPAFIVLALFQGTRGLFEGWLKAVVMLAVTPLLAVLLGAGVLELAVPVVRSIGGATADTRAVGALFLLAAVYLALMVMALKGAGMIVGGWRLPGTRESREASGNAAAPASTIVPATVSATAAPAAAASSEAARTRAIISALPTPANDVRPAAAGESRTRTVITQPGIAPASGAPSGGGGDRLRGLGSRFRPAPASFTKEKRP